MFANISNELSSSSDIADNAVVEKYSPVCVQVGTVTRSSQPGFGRGLCGQKAQAVGTWVDVMFLRPPGDILLGGGTGFGHGLCLQKAQAVGTWTSVFISVFVLRHGLSRVVLFPKGSAGGVHQQALSVLMGPL